jgi:hypothetical protein
VVAPAVVARVVLSGPLPSRDQRVRLRGTAEVVPLAPADRIEQRRRSGCVRSFAPATVVPALASLGPQKQRAMAPVAGLWRPVRRHGLSPPAKLSLHDSIRQCIAKEAAFRPASDAKIRSNYGCYARAARGRSGPTDDMGGSSTIDRPARSIRVFCWVVDGVSEHCVHYRGV